MDSDDVQLLYAIGQALLIDIAELVSQSILYGMYLAIFALSMRCLLQRRSLTTQTLIMLIFLSLLFITSTVYLATSIIFNVIQIRVSLLENLELSLADRLAISDQQTTVWSIVGDWSSTYGLPLTVADAVVVWRACVLWPDNRIIKSLLSMLLIITFALSIAAGILSTQKETSAGTDIITSLPANFLIAMTASSLLTNIMATAMIGVKAYQHRKTMKRTQGLQTSKTLRVLSFLAESGAVYCALQVVYAGTQIPVNTNFNAFSFVAPIYGSIFCIISCAYPSIIFLVIHYNHSIAVYTGVEANSSFEQQGVGEAGTHVSFAPNPASHLEMGTTSSSQYDISHSQSSK